MELKSYQIRVRTDEVLPGDFLDYIEPSKLSGPRGGKYRFDGVTVESKVTVAGYGLPTFSRYGFGIKTRSNPGFSLPGNLAQITTAVVRVREDGSRLSEEV